MKKFVRPFLYKKYINLVFFINNLKPIFYVNMKSYSEFGEDLIIEKLMNSNIGGYIDIGAGHPIIGNNTYYFYKKGWRGVTVEPIKFHNSLHKIMRKGDIRIMKLVSENTIKTKFYEFNPTQYSTSSTEQYREMVIKGMKERRVYYVDSISINQAISMVNNSNYFLSIDCEGYDSTIIKSINWNNKNLPLVIIFEKINNQDEYAYVQALLLKSGYIEVASTNNNLIYKLQK
jgi:FkbM family methyltransferase